MKQKEVLWQQQISLEIQHTNILEKKNQTAKNLSWKNKNESRAFQTTNTALGHEGHSKMEQGVEVPSAKLTVLPKFFGFVF